jgi:hypothetical protein
MAFPLQQWLQKRTSMFRCKYVTKTFKFNGEGTLDVEFFLFFSRTFVQNIFRLRAKILWEYRTGVGPNYKIYESQTSVLFVPKSISLLLLKYFKEFSSNQYMIILC